MRSCLFLVAGVLLPALLWIACRPAADAPAAGAAADADPIRAIDAFIEAHRTQAEPLGRIDTSDPRWRFKLPKPPAVAFPADTAYFWNLQTNKGPVRVRLRPDVAPMHVANVLYLTQLGFYDGLPFHRAIQGFMVQGGCPAGNGMGDPGYRLSLEVGSGLRHDRPGQVASANSGPNTDGSQFYILFSAAPQLDGGYSVWGELADDRRTESMLTLRAMEKVSPASEPIGGTASPLEPLILEKAEITAEPAAGGKP